ncbi:NADP oxidoreductase coenzyme F420-dependent [Cooperia oncophora]
MSCLLVIDYDHAARFAKPAALRNLGLQTTHDNTEVIHKSDVIFLAVKPPHVSKVASEIAPILNREQLVVSIALGITIRNIESLLPSKSRVVRVMPNTPAVVRAGASAFAVGSACRDGDAELVRFVASASSGLMVKVRLNISLPYADPGGMRLVMPGRLPSFVMPGVSS